MTKVQAKDEIAALLRKTLGEHIPPEQAKEWARAVVSNKKKICETLQSLMGEKNEETHAKENSVVEEILSFSGERNKLDEESVDVDFSESPENVAASIVRNAKEQKMQNDQIMPMAEKMLKQKKVASSKQKKIKKQLRKQLGLDKKMSKDTDYKQPRQEGYKGPERKKKMYGKNTKRYCKDTKKMSKDTDSEEYSDMKEESTIVDRIHEITQSAQPDEYQRLKLAEGKGGKKKDDYKGTMLAKDTEEEIYNCKYCGEKFHSKEARDKHQRACAS